MKYLKIASLFLFIWLSACSSPDLRVKERGHGVSRSVYLKSVCIEKNRFNKDSNMADLLQANFISRGIKANLYRFADTPESCEYVLTYAIGLKSYPDGFNGHKRSIRLNLRRYGKIASKVVSTYNYTENNSSSMLSVEDQLSALMDRLLPRYPVIAGLDTPQASQPASSSK